MSQDRLFSPILLYFHGGSPLDICILYKYQGGRVLRENKAKHTRVNTPRKHSLAISTVEGSEMCLIVS